MKNIDQIKSRYAMWTSVNDFLTYKELVELSAKYYNRTIVFCFANKEKDLYVIKFKLLDNGSFELEYSYFSEILKQVYQAKASFGIYYEFSHLPKILKKYNFKKNIQNIFKIFESNLIYYCHLYDIYKLITSSID